jgi:hypothetical protein
MGVSLEDSNGLLGRIAEEEQRLCLHFILGAHGMYFHGNSCDRATEAKIDT